jgi:hypothetical protein
VVEVCIHAANILYLLSFLARDILWLRVLTCCGLVLGIVFFTCQTNPLYGPTVWHVVFLMINGVQIHRLIKERRRLMLPPQVEKAAEDACRGLSRDQLLTLLTRAMWAHPDTMQDVRRTLKQPLSAEERVMRDMALGHLTRKEMLNLLTRRLWCTVQWAWGGRWASRDRTPRGEIACAFPTVANVAPTTANQFPALENRP